MKKWGGKREEDRKRKRDWGRSLWLSRAVQKKKRLKDWKTEWNQRNRRDSDTWSVAGYVRRPPMPVTIPYHTWSLHTPLIPLPVNLPSPEDHLTHKRYISNRQINELYFSKDERYPSQSTDQTQPLIHQQQLIPLTESWDNRSQSQITDVTIRNGGSYLSYLPPPYNPVRKKKERTQTIQYHFTWTERRIVTKLPLVFGFVLAGGLFCFGFTVWGCGQEDFAWVVAWATVYLVWLFLTDLLWEMVLERVCRY